MSKQFVKCPKDPRKEYLREVCEEIFRKGRFRHWCRTCEQFQDNPAAAEKA